MTDARTGSAPASRRVLAQLLLELRQSLRRGESFLVTVLIPVGVLLSFAATIEPPPGYDSAVEFVLPGVLALAVMSAGMVSLGIATAYERYYRVLKRLGVTPLTRLDLVLAKIGSVLAVEVIQVALLVLIAVLAFDWRPAGSVWAAVPLLILGTACFAGIGLLMAGALRAEATLGLANGLYLVFLALGGIALPLSSLPGWVEPLARLLPATALAAALRAVLGQGAAPDAADIIVLVLWSLAAVLLTARTFKWE